MKKLNLTRYSLLAVVTAILCIFSSPVFAKLPHPLHFPTLLPPRLLYCNRESTIRWRTLF